MHHGAHCFILDNFHMITLISILSVVHITVKVGSFEEAKRAADAGVDAIIVQGREAGGHIIGQVRVLLSYHIMKFLQL